MTRHFLLLLFFATLLSCGAQAQAVRTQKKLRADSTSTFPDCALGNEEEDKIFTRLEVIAGFKGGSEKWFEFAKKHFDFLSVEKIMGDSITIFRDSLIVKFVVTKNGTLCSISILKGNPALTAPVLKLLRSSPKWAPGTNGGRNLNSYRFLRIDVFIDKKENARDIPRCFNSYYRTWDS